MRNLFAGILLLALAPMAQAESQIPKHYSSTAEDAVVLYHNGISEATLVNTAQDGYQLSYVLMESEVVNLGLVQTGQSRRHGENSCQSLQTFEGDTIIESDSSEPLYVLIASDCPDKSIYIKIIDSRSDGDQMVRHSIMYRAVE